MARKNDAAELEALNAEINALEATVERLMKDKAVRDPVDALIRALRGYTQEEIERTLDVIRDEVADTLMDEGPDDDILGSYGHGAQAQPVTETARQSDPIAIAIARSGERVTPCGGKRR